MGQSQEAPQSRNNKRYSDTPWFWQVLVITVFISLSLAADGLACHTVTLTPTSLAFYAVQDATNPPTQSINVSRTTSSTVTLTASDNRSWLTVSPSTQSFSTSAKLTAAVNTSGRGAGTYNSTITIMYGTWCTYTAPVSLVISPPSTTPPPSTSSATLTWKAVTGASVSGYKVYVGEAPRQYTRNINVGNVTSSTVNSLARGRTYYFAVTAYNSGGEGPPSNEATTTLP